MARLKYPTLDRPHSLEKALLEKVERKEKRMTNSMGNGLSYNGDGRTIGRPEREGGLWTV